MSSSPAGVLNGILGFQYLFMTYCSWLLSGFNLALQHKTRRNLSPQPSSNGVLANSADRGCEPDKASPDRLHHAI